MFLVAWWLTGVFLGWIIWAFYRIWRRERWSRGLSAGAAGILSAVTKTATAAILAVWARLRPERQPENNRPVRRRRPVGVTGWKLTRAAFLALFVIAFAAATDHAQLLQCMLVLKSYLVGVRMQALTIGILSGIAFRQYRWPLRRFGHRLGKAVIGDKENTAWALQSAVAIGLIAVGFFVVRPDFLLYLRSFKFGTVEATFGDQGPLPLRDARLNLRDFREKLFVDQYHANYFSDNFLSENSPRGLARSRLTVPQNSALQKEAGEVTALLFGRYVSPVLSSIYCLDSAHALRAANHDPDLAAYSSAWEDFLLQVHRNKSLLTPVELESFLTVLRNSSIPFVERARRASPRCAAWPAVGNLSIETATADAADLFVHYQAAIDALGRPGHDNPAIRPLTVFDPYLVGIVADLIFLASGDREKIDFLMNILDDFPLSDEFITPGIINLYYQVTDSWLNSTGPVPLDLVRSQIEYATHGADMMMARSTERLNQIERMAPVGPETATPETKAKIKAADEAKEKAEKEAENMRKIYGIFLRNSFATLTAEVDIYVQRVLEGETVPEGHRQSWIKAASRLQAMLRARLMLPVVNIDGLFPVELDDRIRRRLREDEGLDPILKIDPDFLLQADLAIALSAILLPEGNRVNALNCSAALFYINEAATSARQTINTNGLDKAQERRLRQLIQAVLNRAGESCTWTDPTVQIDGRRQANTKEPTDK